MNKIIDSFSNRDTALVIWIGISFFLMLLNKPLRDCIIGILKALFVKKILITILLFVLYISLTVIFLRRINLWDASLLKDTLFWGISFGFVLIVKLKKADSNSYFKEVLKEALKWAVFIEFIVNFYTFSLTVELIILPILITSAVLQAYSSFDTKHKQVENFLIRFINIVSLAILLWVIYKTTTSLSQLLTYDNFKSFILPLILTTVFMPFIYLLAVFAKYEDLYVRLNFSISDAETRKNLKLYIFKIAGVNLDKIVSISNNIAKPTFGYQDYSIEMVKKISTGKYVGFDE